MLRQLNWRLAAACGLVLLTAATASAQRGRGGYSGGDSTSGLLRSDAVLKELEVTDEQKADIAKILEEARGERSGTNFRDLSEDERTAKFAELREQAAKRNAEALAKVEKVLLPPQMKRLKQLAVQQRGLRALSDAEVAKSLKLSEAQQKDIAAALESNSEKMRALFQGGNREGAREKMAELRKESEAAVLGILSDEQKKELENLKGEAFEFPQRTSGRQGGGQDRQRPDRRPNT